MEGPYITIYSVVMDHRTMQVTSILVQVSFVSRISLSNHVSISNRYSLHFHKYIGRVDLGLDGCNQIGPKWNFNGIPHEPERRRFFLDSGGPTDQPSLITSGKSWKYDASGKSIKIKNNRDIPDTVYETHRSAPVLEYKIGGFEAATPYKVSLGFAEVWEPNCFTGKRVMAVRINGNLYENKLDVFDRTKECGAALVESYILPANVRGEFVVNLAASVENAMLSSIDIIPIS